jgi:hypothetical protein
VAVVGLAPAVAERAGEISQNAVHVDGHAESRPLCRRRLIGAILRDDVHHRPDRRSRPLLSQDGSNRTRVGVWSRTFTILPSVARRHPQQMQTGVDGLSAAGTVHLKFANFPVQVCSLYAKSARGVCDSSPMPGEHRCNVLALELRSRVT